MRLIVMGPPRSAKSVIAEYVAAKFGLEHIRTDDFRSEGWLKAKRKVLNYLKPRKDFVLSGMQAPRVLRAGLKVDAALVTVCDLESLKYHYWMAGDGHKNVEGVVKSTKTIIDEALRRNPTAVIYLNTSGKRCLKLNYEDS